MTPAPEKILAHTRAGYGTSDWDQLPTSSQERILGKIQEGIARTSPDSPLHYAHAAGHRASIDVWRRRQASERVAARKAALEQKEREAQEKEAAEINDFCVAMAEYRALAPKKALKSPRTEGSFQTLWERAFRGIGDSDPARQKRCVRAMGYLKGSETLHRVLKWRTQCRPHLDFLRDQVPLRFAPE